MKYLNALVAIVVYNDLLFVSEKNKNVWWYDRERISFRTPSYVKILENYRHQYCGHSEVVVPTNKLI